METHGDGGFGSPGEQATPVLNPPRSRPYAAWIAALTVCACLRLFFFTASFPIFNQLDESAHFDTILKYTQSGLPREKIALYAPETGRLSALYGSSEFMSAQPPAPPVWRSAPDVQQRAVDAKLARLAVNHEANQPPLYYAIAALWYRALHAAGEGDLELVYGLRFLNLPFYAAFMALAARFVRRLFPLDAVIQWGTPLLLSFWPLDSFYGLSNDIINPPVYTAGLLLLLDVFQGRDGVGRCALAGFVAGLSFLVKYSNFTMAVPVAAAALACAARNRTRPKGAALRIAVLGAAALAPGLWWVSRSLRLFDSVSGLFVITYIWTPKPLAHWLPHPIFTPGGAFFFFKELLLTLWRGEMDWKGVTLRSGWADALALIVMVVGFAGSIWDAAVDRDRRGPIMVFWAMFVLGIGFLVYVSVKYDFGVSPYPSRELPFLFSGRYLAGALCALAILIVSGLDRVLRRATGDRRWALAAVAGFVLVSTVSEARLTLPATRSAYNLFHLAR